MFILLDSYINNIRIFNRRIYPIISLYIPFRSLHNYAIFKSGLYKTDKELKRVAIIDWIKGPIIELLAFCLIFVDFRLALALIFVVTITYIIPSKKI